MNREQMIEKAAERLRTVNLWCNECDGVKCSSCDEQAIEFSNTVLDAILPQVTTVAELEALPFDAKVIDPTGEVWARYRLAAQGERPLRWRSTRGADGWTSERLLSGPGVTPLTVVWQP